MNVNARRAVLVGGLLLVFIVLPIAEIGLLVRVVEAVGIWAVLAFLICSALLGAWLTRRSGSRSWRAIQTALGEGRIPTGHLADGALVLAGGILLILPGFLTDLIGVVLLVPFTRPVIRKFIGFLLAKRVANGGVEFRFGPLAGPGVIPGETVPDPEAEPPQPTRG